jgi:hypothetical protein
MTDPDLIRNPDDPWNRQWGSGSVITSVVVIVILAGIIAYGAAKTSTTATGAIEQVGGGQGTS